MIEGIIFDMDGLMIDSEHVADLALKQAAEELGFIYSDEVRDKTIGKQSAAVFQVYVEAYGGEKNAEIIRKRMKELIDDSFNNHGIPVKKGLYELLDYLDSHNLKKIVASSSNRKTIENCLTKINVLSRFNSYIGGNEITNGKPNPEIFIKACAKIEIKPQNALVLEDSVAGVSAASNGGIPVVLIPDICKHSEESKNKAVAVLNNLSEVIDFIKHANNWRI
jgi:HAD superfamily hydrolase (TIGR01509 family)